MQAYLILRWIAGFGAQVRDFRADSAALPILMSSVEIAITGGTENSHCNATGALPEGESIVTENNPGALRSVWDGGRRKDWPHRTTPKINPVTHLAGKARNADLSLRPRTP